jgi:hypothetical protein
MLKIWFVILALPASASEPDAVIQRSTRLFAADWQAASQYEYVETDREKDRSPTYQVMMIRGSPYQRLEAIDGKALSPADQQKEQQKLDKVIAERCAESSQKTEERIGAFKKDQERQLHLLEELTKAFDFNRAGEALMDGHKTWLFNATPRPDYHPLDNETKVLTGMQGRLWVDQESLQWVKVEADVIHPVSIEGFLARVEPGTRFELSRAPAPDGHWLPTHFSVRSKAEILGIINHKGHQDQTWSDYKKAPPDAKICEP